MFWEDLRVIGRCGAIFHRLQAQKNMKMSPLCLVPRMCPPRTGTHPWREALDEAEASHSGGSRNPGDFRCFLDPAFAGVTARGGQKSLKSAVWESPPVTQRDIQMTQNPAIPTLDSSLRLRRLPRTLIRGSLREVTLRILPASRATDLLT